MLQIATRSSLFGSSACGVVDFEEFELDFARPVPRFRNPLQATALRRARVRGLRLRAMATVNLQRRAEIGRIKRERTRAMLIESALKVVAQRGFDAPTIDDFISAAQVARGTFYNYFATREALLVALGAHVADTIDAEILALFKGIDDPARRIAIAIHCFIAISKRDPDWGWVLVRSLPTAGGGWSEGMRRGVLADIRRGRRTGRFRIPSVQSAVVLGIGTLGAAIRTVLVEPTPPNFSRQIAAMTLQGLGMALDEAEEVAALPIPDRSKRPAK